MHINRFPGLQCFTTRARAPAIQRRIIREGNLSGRCNSRHSRAIVVCNALAGTDSLAWLQRRLVESYYCSWTKTCDGTSGALGVRVSTWLVCCKPLHAREAMGGVSSPTFARHVNGRLRAGRVAECLRSRHIKLSGSSSPSTATWVLMGE